MLYPGSVGLLQKAMRPMLQQGQAKLIEEVPYTTTTTATTTLLLISTQVMRTVDTIIIIIIIIINVIYNALCNK